MRGDKMMAHRLGSFWRWLILATVFGVVAAATAHAGLLDDVKLYFAERKQIAQHSKNIGNGVRDLWRERKSIAELNSSAMALVRVYRDLKARGKTDFMQLVNIARNAVNLINCYQRVAPKVVPVYEKMQPDLEYFSQLHSDFGNTQDRFPPKTISDSRINKLAGAAGWSNVWSSIKENPANLFRWGRLKAEYQLGKAEAGYSLKCAQIALEATSYWNTAKGCLGDLFAVKNEIDSLLSGNLNALLNAPTLGNRVMSATSNVDQFAELINRGPSHFDQRFTELGQYQNQYVEAHRNHQQVVGVAPAPSTATSWPTGAQSPGTVPGTPTRTTGTATTTRPGAVPPTGTWVDLQTANEAYAKAYREYVACTMDPNCPQARLQQALSNLGRAQEMLEAARSRGR